MIAAHAAMGGLNPRGSAEYRRAEQKLRDAAVGKRDRIFRGNHVHNRTPASGPVALLSIVGDTGGDDISIKQAMAPAVGQRAGVANVLRASR